MKNERRVAGGLSWKAEVYPRKAGLGESGITRKKSRLRRKQNYPKEKKNYHGKRIYQRKEELPDMH